MLKAVMHCAAFFLLAAPVGSLKIAITGSSQGIGLDAAKRSISVRPIYSLDARRGCAAS